MAEEIEKDRYVLTVSIYSKNEAFLQSLVDSFLKEITLSSGELITDELNLKIERSY